MWMDETGRAHSMAVEDPGLFLSSALRARVLDMSDNVLADFTDSVNTYIVRFLEDLEKFVRQPDEEEYRDRLPPAEEFLVDVPDGPDIATPLLDQLSRIQLRWRGDVYFGLVQFLTDESESRPRR